MSDRLGNLLNSDSQALLREAGTAYLKPDTVNVGNVNEYSFNLKTTLNSLWKYQINRPE